MLNLKIHTVILLVGPSGCGKTYLSKNKIIPLVRKQIEGCLSKANIQYLSSDDLRRELLGDPNITYGKNTHEMQAVSEQAFDLLYRKLELVTSYPVNADIVIVDTTGLNLGFRNKITSIAKNAHYNTCCIVFNYKDRADYYKYLNDTHDLSIVSAQINRLNRDTMGELRKRDFDNYLYIKKKDFDEFEINIEDAEHYASHILPTHLEYPVIGDVHGCYDELMDLLKELRFTVVDDVVTEKPSAKMPILIGDFIDGPDEDNLEKVINFLHKNKDHFKFVTGNHENFVYRYHTKDLDTKSLPPQEIIDNYFPTVHLLAKRPDLAEKFLEIKKISRDFFIGHNFIVTHSPCDESVLGKLHLAALKCQRNFRYPQRQEGETLAEFSQRYENALSFLKTAAATNKPFHIFGHCRVKNVARVKNKIGIDTGCSQGNRLTAATIVGNKVYFTAIASKMPPREELAEVFTRKDAATEILPDIDLNELDHKELGRIKWAAKNKINFISGTMSPSDKDMDACKLETMAKALEYFRAKGVERVCLQPKYMGSRAELLLNCIDVSKSYTSTRRGHLIDHVDLTSSYDRVLTRMKPYAESQGFEWLYLDCELMPWYALGKGLIESQYRPVQAGIESELNLLKETGFEQQLGTLTANYDMCEYAKVRSQMTKEDLRQLLTPNKCASFEALHHLRWISLKDQEAFYEIYKRQLELFAAQGEIHFKPFSLLKAMKADGTEQLFFDMPNSEQFSLLSDDDHLVIDLGDENALSQAEAFFNAIVERELEGVVVKPEMPYIKGVAPFLKVRSPRYLSIIYGYDYMHPPKYEKLVRQKRISRKLATSIDEYEYGKRMLEIPRSEISESNKDYVNLFAKLIFEEKKEERFDPRL